MTDSVTDSGAPPAVATVIAVLADWPRLTVSRVGEAAMVKSGGAVTVSVIGALLVRPPADAVTVSG